MTLPHKLGLFLPRRLRVRHPMNVGMKALRVFFNVPIFDGQFGCALICVHNKTGRTTTLLWALL